MRAARLSSPKRFEIAETDVPEVEDGKCLVKLERWSVCGSDLRHQYSPVWPEEAYPMEIGTPCHEIAGTVVESRSDRFEEGQRTIVLPQISGKGGLVDYMVAEPRHMVPLPEDGDLSEWLMCQPSGTVLYACQRLRPLIGKSVLVLGQGAIGLSFAAICARSGAEKVIAVDPLDYRLETSKSVGATHTINPAKEPLDEVVREITDGRMPEVTIEAAGYPDTLNAALRLVGEFGEVMMFGIQEGTGLSGHTVSISLEGLLYRQPTILPIAGSKGPDPRGPVQSMVNLRSRGWWDPGELVTHHLKFDDVQQAFEMYDNRDDEVIKIVMSG